MAVLQREVTPGAIGGRAARQQERHPFGRGLETSSFAPTAIADGDAAGGRRLPLVRWTRERLRPALVSLAQLYLGGGRPANWQVSENPYHADRVFRTWR